MNPSPAIRRALRALALLLLLGFAWLGLRGGISNLPDSHSLGQKAQTFTQFAYGVFATLGVVTTFWGRRWHSLVIGAWAVAITFAAGLASAVWGGTSLGIAVLSGAAALLIALVITWLLRVGARGLTSA